MEPRLTRVETLLETIHDQIEQGEKQAERFEDLVMERIKQVEERQHQFLLMLIGTLLTTLVTLGTLILQNGKPDTARASTADNPSQTTQKDSTR